MYRTIDEIKALMVESKERIEELWLDIKNEVLADPVLAQLNSTSQTSIWQLWAFIQAVNVWVLEQMYKLHKAEILEINAEGRVMSLPWFAAQSKAWQYGHALQVVDFAYGYAVDDASARIITQAAANEGGYGGMVVIKVAKGQVGALQPLTPAELLAFESYINQIKGAGTITNVTSLPADDLKVTLTVHFDGIYILADLQQRVEQAITNYLQLLPFNSLFYITQFLETILDVEGVIDVAINSIEAKQGAAPYQAIPRNYQSTAGYMQIDSAFPLASQITYNPMP